MDSHDLMIQLLPAKPPRLSSHGGQSEAFHLVHVAAHWLVKPATVALEIWALCLVMALLAWIAWSFAWLLRWPGRASRARKPIEMPEEP